MIDNQKALLDVLANKKPKRRPIWFMRQAGRYLDEYRKVRKKAGSFLDLCYTPDLAAEVTLQPLKRFDIDAAILFADILLIPHSLGVEVGFVENEGPKLSTIRLSADLKKLSINRSEEILQPVYKTVSLTRAGLPDHVCLIGFSGAPWTVATYMIEGGTSPDRALARKAAFSGEQWFDDLIRLIVDSSIDYLENQVKAGAEVLQIFDSWASDLPDMFRRRYCFEPVRRIVEGLRDRGINVPVIGFARGIGPAHLEFGKYTAVDALGLESALDVSWIKDNLLDEFVVQGNLDPILLEYGGEAMDAGIRNLVSQLPADRHIFNLGHGIRQRTPVENVEQMIDIVRSYDDK